MWMENWILLILKNIVNKNVKYDDGGLVRERIDE